MAGEVPRSPVPARPADAPAAAPAASRRKAHVDSLLFVSDVLNHKVDQKLLEPYFYTAESKGKQIRKKLTEAFNVWLRLDDVRLGQVQEMVAKLHNASLMVDDIEDSSKMRRGRPVAHKVFGEASTINAANYVYFLSMTYCVQMGQPEALSIFAEEMLNLHRGQGWDIYWRDQGVCPSEAEYTRMVVDKTGGLFRLAVRMMVLFSTHKALEPRLIALVNKIGLFFQVLDDLINLTSTAYMKNKSFCEDLTEGKFSFPILHAVHANTDDTRLINILRQRTEDEEVKAYCVRYMRSVGSFAYTRAYLEKLYATITDDIAALGGNPALSAIMERLAATLADTHAADRESDSSSSSSSM